MNNDDHATHYQPPPVTPSSPYGRYVPPPPNVTIHETPTAARNRQRFQRWGLVGLAGVIVALFVVSCSIMTSAKKHPIAATVVISPSATPQPSGFYATTTPAPGATMTPTLAPGQPSPTPILIYVTARPAPTQRPGTPYPTYTAQPGATAYPTYTTPPAPTATSTPHPTQTMTDDENDLSQMSGHTANIVCCDTGYVSSFNGDPSRVVDTASSGGDWATYAKQNIVSAQVKLYFSPNDATVPCDFLMSDDGVAWHGVQASWVDDGGTWDERIYTINAPGNDFKIVWNSPYPYSPELGQVSITYQP